MHVFLSNDKCNFKIQSLLPGELAETGVVLLSKEEHNVSAVPTLCFASVYEIYRSYTFEATNTYFFF